MHHSGGGGDVSDGEGYAYVRQGIYEKSLYLVYNISVNLILLIKIKSIFK